MVERLAIVGKASTALYGLQGPGLYVVRYGACRGHHGALTGFQGVTA
jgi:hypothetical protein